MRVNLGRLFLAIVGLSTVTFIGLILWLYIKIPPVPQRGGVFVEGIVGQPRQINPLYADLNPVDKQLCSLLFRGLVTYDHRNRPAGDLASEWEISEDGKIYTAKLKQGSKWDDGREVTAYDVVFTYSLTQKEEYKGPEKTTFKEVIIEQVDPYTVKFTLKQPFSPFLESLSLGILPQHLWGNVPLDRLETHYLNLHPIGNSDVKFHSLKLGAGGEVESILFRLEQGYLNFLKFKFFLTDDLLITAFKLGGIQAFVTTDDTITDKLSSWKNQVTYTYPLWGRHCALFFNLNQESLTEINLRKSLASAVPREKLPGFPASGPLPPASKDYYVRRTPPPFDLEEAQTLLRESNLTLPFEFKLTTPRQEEYLKVAQILKDEWEKVQINLEINAVEEEELKGIIQNKDFQLLLLEEEIGHDPDQYVFLHSTQVEFPGLNISGFSNRRLDKALEDGRKKYSLEERKEEYKKVQILLNEELPVIYLYHPQIYYVMSSKVKGVSLGNLWFPQDRFASLSQWYMKEGRKIL